MNGTKRFLPANSNQAVGLGEYCRDFLFAPQCVSPETLALTERFHIDSVGCGVSALHHHANACTVLRRESLQTRPTTAQKGGICLGAHVAVDTVRSVGANVAAVREWDSNGTNFGYDKNTGHVAGEFGHNDFYPVAVAAGREKGFDGNRTLRMMLLIDEIRGRLAEVFPLRKYGIDHVHHGAVACAAAFTAALGGCPLQIESAIGLVVAHYVPFRAIRAGDQLSDSKGSSAAFAAETALLASYRAIDGFQGPRDIFRNPLAIYRLNEPCRDGLSPFDLNLGESGDAFAIHSMHFKLGLYEHQSASALQSLINLLAITPQIVKDLDSILSITITIYEPAFSIIADPAKRSPQTRQSADHSLPYIVAKTLQKAALKFAAGYLRCGWIELMLLPEDYSNNAITSKELARVIEKIHIQHGGQEYDSLYPEGIPARVSIVHKQFGKLDGELCIFPLGHSQSDPKETALVVNEKFERLVGEAVESPKKLAEELRLCDMPADHVASLYSFRIKEVPTK